MSGGAPKGNRNHLKHGKCHSRIYHIWKSMRKRCSNPKDSNFKKYGERGISVCNEWENFQSFYDWAIANGYQETLTIDRIDFNGNYEPSNCRWATYAQQANNRKSNKMVEYNGELHTVADWARLFHVPAKPIYYKLKKGLSMYEIVQSMRCKPW